MSDHTGMKPSASYEPVARVSRTKKRTQNAPQGRQRVYLGIALVLVSYVLGWILGGIFDLWGPGPIGEFLYGLIGHPAVGSLAVGVLALCAAFIAYRGVLHTISAANNRAVFDREMVNDREREAARHDRFLRMVEQLASPHSTVRLGGLLATGALADEWEREARRLLLEDSDEGRVSLESQRAARFFLAIENYRDAQSSEGKAWRDLDRNGRRNAESDYINAREELLAAREGYMLLGPGVPTIARDAVGQRDACIELICSYLRAKRMPPEMPIDGERVDLPNLRYERERSFALGGEDIAARQVAVKLVRDHTQPDSAYIWPGVEIDLTDAHLEYANLDLVVLDGSSLKATYLGGAEIKWAYLRYACLDGADMEGADLIHSHLEGATMKGADLGFAFLEKTYLQKADLSDVDMKATFLSGAHLGSEETKDEVQLISFNSEPVMWDEETKWPAGFNAEEVIERQRAAWRTDGADDV